MKISAFIGSAVVAAGAALAGCAPSGSARAEPAASAAAPPPPGQDPGAQGMGAQGAGPMSGPWCPTQVEGATVAPVDVERGAALDFKTSTGDVAELRRRVRAMAEMQNQRGGGMGMGRGMGRGGGMGMFAATASAEDIEGGARLVLLPNDPAQLEALREHTRLRAERMALGQCPMMTR
ncbi:MAG: hypothetical protein IT372_27410 [Polyangiaceae bacterium]|nr:hypothetical protein [Polyangiaceae bacterium]